MRQNASEIRRAKPLVMLTDHGNISDHPRLSKENDGQEIQQEQYLVRNKPYKTQRSRSLGVVNYMGLKLVL